MAESLHFCVSPYKNVERSGRRDERDKGVGKKRREGRKE